MAVELASAVSGGKCRPTLRQAGALFRRWFFIGSVSLARVTPLSIAVTVILFVLFNTLDIYTKTDGYLRCEKKICRTCFRR